MQEILDEADTRLLQGDQFPLSFSSQGISSGEDLSILLTALSTGGEKARLVANSGIGQHIVNMARDTDLEEALSRPTDLQILESVFPVKTFMGMAVFNRCKDTYGQSAVGTMGPQRFMLADGRFTVEDDTVDNRLSKFIKDRDGNSFAMLRWRACLKAAHGPLLADKWYMQMAQMLDQLADHQCASDDIKPLLELRRRVMSALPSKLLSVAKQCQVLQPAAVQPVRPVRFMGGVAVDAPAHLSSEPHVGEELAQLTLVLDNWSQVQEKIKLQHRMEWMQALAMALTKGRQQPMRQVKGGGTPTSVSQQLAAFQAQQQKQKATPAGGGKGGANKRKRGSPPEVGTATTASLSDQNLDPAMKKALSDLGFDSLSAAKADFLKTKPTDGVNRCFWAVSEAGVKLGGCCFSECKFSHKGIT